ncbi:hypothetical protein Lepto7376_1219 [[Leptolyngbya] sp. PCC 7376]|uniref:hypothetical protein n=1 Tax=[Leptolyngbya] sp. PCC 7376 TaxID=111781 RepID=UPI00029EC39A|nr:hypothetical protein [[Leptolyngbya] sp. PCC 7376]AFY37576.1 hypothetical protein Lepto7376_1219 [[Leptolyngbya] sp. PCC 7376]
MFAPTFRKNKTQRSIFSPERSLGWRRRQEQTSAQQFTDMQIGFPKTAGRVVPVEEEELPDEVAEAIRDILNFFVKLSKTSSISSLLENFELFFIDHDPNSIPQNLNHSIYQLLVYNCTSDFIYLLNRCSFLIVNSCLKQKKTKHIEKLIDLFQNPSTLPSNASLATRKFRDWVDSYKSSRQYKILELFSPAAKVGNKTWHDRYIRLTLLAQTFDVETPIEQRQACQFLYQFLKNRYKFQLVMYLTKGCDEAPAKAKVSNPTLIHPSTLKLIQKIVVKRGQGYPQMAEEFMEQHEQGIYADFKKALVEHLLTSIGGDRRLKWLPKKMEQHLDTIYPEKSSVTVGHHLITKTCDETICYLLNPESFVDPTHPFTLMMIQREFLSLSIILLKLVLISPRSYGQLIQSLNDLMQHYRHKSQDECEWLTGLLETVQVILTLGVNEAQYYSFANAA